MKLTMMMAITADGMIARNDAHFPDWTCSADKKLFKRLTQQAGVVIFGSRTYDTIGRPLPGRLNVIMTRHPERYEPSEGLLFHSDTPERLLEQLSRMGHEQVILAGGGVINTLFVKARLVDELLLTISPKLFGQGLPLFTEKLDLDLKLIHLEQLETDTLLIRYAVRYPDPSSPMVLI
jgi:dihydrofolate reductase